MSRPPIIIIVAAAMVLTVTHALAWRDGHQRGYEQGHVEERALQQGVRDDMRGIGICEWVTAMQSHYQCPRPGYDADAVSKIIEAAP